MKTDGIIFDIDGTIWDAVDVIVDSWNETMARIGGAAVERSRVEGLLGMTYSQIVDTLRDEFGDDADRLCRSCVTDECAYLTKHGGKLYPGITEAVDALAKKYPLYIVSNCQDGYVQALYASTGLGRYFFDWECEGRTGRQKAENILLLSERNGLKNSIYIGDTHIDEEACREAGCRFIYASYGFGRAEAPFATVNTPAELVEVMERIDGNE